MKLTKSQRLFIKAGKAQAEIEYWKWVDQSIYRSDDTPDCSINIAKLKKRRKKLIRKALEAARSENTEHYMNGINEVLRQIGR